MNAEKDSAYPSAKEIDIISHCVGGMCVYVYVCGVEGSRRTCMGKHPPRGNEERSGCGKVISWICPSEHLCGFDFLIFHQKQDASQYLFVGQMGKKFLNCSLRKALDPGWKTRFEPWFLEFIMWLSFPLY